MNESGVRVFFNLQDAECFFNNRKKIGIKPGLGRIEKLLSMLDHPEKKIRAIHVAGTNGKGSTIHFIHAALQANGYHTGIFTSPSFDGLLGHIFLNDQTIQEETFLIILNKMLPFIEQLDKQKDSPTEFEIISALAFVYFANNSDFVLIETGMGGRYDTTNICIPILSIITNVSNDHTDYLGESLVEIANHKAGIIKRNTPVIVGDMEYDALTVILEEADEKNASVFAWNEDYCIENDKELSKFIWRSGDKLFPVSLSMLGEHQFKNASVALKAVEQFEKMGYFIDWKDVVSAIEKMQLPGRYEVLHQNPYVIADAAHNIEGVKSFIHTVRTRGGKHRHVIVAMFSDKDIKEILRLLSEQFDMVTVTTFDHPRAASEERLYDEIKTMNKQKTSNWKKAVTKCLNENSDFYITGSLHFITIVRSYFEKINRTL